MKKTSKQVNRQERVLARTLAEEELNPVQGADTVVFTQGGARKDITDSNNGDIAQ